MTRAAGGGREMGRRLRWHMMKEEGDGVGVELAARNAEKESSWEGRPGHSDETEKLIQRQQWLDLADLGQSK